MLARVWCALMLSQPLVVFCPDPCLLSDVMVSLQSLIAPLQPLHDFRPFFTIYDIDYAAIAAAASDHALATPLLAGTNDPFVVETLGGVMDVLVVPAACADSASTVHSVRATHHSSHSATPPKPRAHVTPSEPTQHAASPPAANSAGGVVEFVSMAALKRLFTAADTGCWYVEHEALKPEAFLEKFTVDVEAILFRGNCEEWRLL